MWNALHSYLKTWDWRLFLFILLLLGLPNIYQLYRVYLIGNELPDVGSLAIVSQWQFVGLVVEVFQEATVLAIFFFLGSQIKSGLGIQLDRAKSVFAFIFLASLVFSVGVFVFRDSFISLIGTPDEILGQTRGFLGISIFSIPFTLLAASIIVLFESLGMRALVFLMAIANVVLRFALDSLFFGGYWFSLQQDVTGVAWATLLASLGLFLVGCVILVGTKRISLGALRARPSFSDMRQYLWVGLGSGSDSLVRNLFYFFMIVRILNTIGSTEIGGYYLTMQIIWSFMLVPVLALADSTKALVANASDDIHRVRTLLGAAILIAAGLMVAWLVVAPFFSGIAGLLSNDPETIKWAEIAFGLLFVPYILLSFNLVMDSAFYGLGVTKFLAYQSIITNGSVYLIAFLLYVTGVWTPTFESVMMLFGLGIVTDTMLTVFFLVRAVYFDGGRNNISQPEMGVRDATMRQRVP